MNELQELNLRVARGVTRQASRVIICPACASLGKEVGLTQDTNAPEVLRCPECGVEIYVSVNGWPQHYRDRPIHEWLRHINCEGEINR
jgi:DNA-directed RNA polymerase subunit RPC12/RpoP